MEGQLTEARDAYLCGLFARAQQTLTEIQSSASYAKWDNMMQQELQSLMLQCQLASSSDWTAIEKNLDSLSAPQQAIYHAAKIMAPKATGADTQASSQWFKGQHGVLDPSTRALAALALGVLTPSGEPANDSSELGSLNASIGSIVSANAPESSAYEAILLLLGDRPDLASKVIERLLLSTDDSILPQVMQCLLTIVKGQWQSVYHTVQDLESILAVDVGPPSARLECIKGLARLHGKHYVDAVEILTKAAEETGYTDPVVLISLIAALQNASKMQEAADLTE
eukprot:Blabericola_migrator_1__2651@NODE_1751_length_3859_cov_45_437236_g1128_i0_p2_GENE_NODE_1751_length_3859_cov_45_437236_g1128_i0NODE_1751_length_3859_cov_45_437236_g1128_i0_p2_ORF_typecomplete_len283_score51_69Coatomer_E/PF04733_14/3_1e16RPN7/PF10602_9/1_7e03RPN7/PF10602_9/0_15_NODE_1751_length_3859_cov_45_437236_g1128_i029003748